MRLDRKGVDTLKVFPDGRLQTNVITHASYRFLAELCHVFLRRVQLQGLMQKFPSFPTIALASCLPQRPSLTDERIVQMDHRLLALALCVGEVLFGAVALAFRFGEVLFRAVPL